jgi:hypothetical protein
MDQHSWERSSRCSTGPFPQLSPLVEHFKRERQRLLGPGELALKFRNITEFLNDCLIALMQTHEDGTRQRDDQSAARCRAAERARGA